ncbi:MAG: hypothetical protein FJ304_10380 [Planctomycetes bacterium]|nr:hypothetical protein [Planctomycetota bacterium]
MACPGQTPFDIDAYNVENIRVLNVLEAIRLRPGMYIGSTDTRGLFYLLFELVSNSFAEVAAGFGRAVRVALRADGSAEVADDGRTFPEGTDAEHVFGVVGHTGHLGYRPDGREYLAYAMANALSESLTGEVRDPNSIYRHTWRRGVTHSAIQTGGPPDDRGLTVRFTPDPHIFGDARFDTGAIRDRLQQLAFLRSGVRVTFADEVAGTLDEFEYANGISDFVRFLNADRVALHPDVIVIRGEEDEVRYEIGLQWCAGAGETCLSFANHYQTIHGGTHATGARIGVARGVRDCLPKAARSEDAFASEDFREGLTAVVSIWHPELMFEGATRHRLSNPEMEAIIAGAVRRGLGDYFAANPDVVTRVVGAATAARDARLAARHKRNAP